jgi:hypothetical protein
MLRPREPRRPAMPNQLPQVIEQRIVALSLGRPGLGPRRISAMLARSEWAGLIVSPTASTGRCAATASQRAPSGWH